jgi:transcriptional regulator with XRE-family HTH domain
MDGESNSLDDADVSALVRTIAANVRALRAAGGLTLPDLAERTGLGRSTLAQLESGRANPSVETLWAIARALGVPFGRLVEAAAPAVRVVRAGQGVRLQLEESALRTRLLTTSPRRGSSELYVMEADPGQPRHAEAHGPGTVEHLFIARGALRAGPLGAPEDLAAGDLLTFAGDVPHVYEALTPDTQAVLLMDYP